MGAHLVIDCLPPVPPGDKPHGIHASLPYDDHRLLQLATKIPGLENRTVQDLVRSFVHIGLKALDEVRTINSPAWQTQMALRNASYERARRKENEENLAALIHNFRDDLVHFIRQDRWTEAFALWIEFYNSAQSMEWFLRQAALWSLATMPIAQAVAFHFANMIPQGFPVPEICPNLTLAESDIGMYRPGMDVLMESQARGVLRSPNFDPRLMLEGPKDNR